MLTRRDVQEALRHLHALGRNHRALDTILVGQASPELSRDRIIHVEACGERREFVTVEVSSELALRAALANRGAEPLAILLAYSSARLPHDIAARVAGGRAQTIDRVRRLKANFHVHRIAPEILATPVLMAALLDDGLEYRPVPGATLDLRTAWLAWLERFGVARDGELSEVAVLELATTTAAGPQLAAELARHAGLADALHRWLHDSVGPVAAVAFQAWEKDEGRRAAALAILLEICAADVRTNGFLRARLKSVLEVLDPALGALVEDNVLLRRWGNLAAPLLVRLERRGEDALLLEEAARLLPDSELAELLGRSRNLPLGWDAAVQALSEKLRQGAASPSRESASTARDALDRLRSHRLADAAANRPVLERARMGVRLVYWLARLELIGEPAATASTDAETVRRIAAWYVEEGAFIDYARRSARGGQPDDLSVALAQVVEAADARRDAVDERFARALAAAPDRRATNELFPIESALDRIAAPFLEKGDHRKLLVLLMDGLSWPVAIELLEDLARVGIEPIRGQPRLSGRQLVPVLSALPTMTKVSRAAFFAGKRPKGADVAQSSDTARFAANPAFSRAGGDPTLLLAGEAIENGDASKAALDLVASDARVVGVVVNAIDDQLRAGPQLRVSYGVEAIRPLKALLDRARFVGRTVLLASDHGHVPGARLEYVAARGAVNARYRALGPGEQPSPREVVFSGESVWRERGVERIALPWSETVCYTAGAREGEHGGASLAELVAPAVLVAGSDLARFCASQGEQDPELETVALVHPAWWDLELPQRAAALPERKPAPKAQPQQTLPLAAFEPPGAQPPEPIPSPRPVTAAPDPFAWLARSKVLAEMLAAHPRVDKDRLLEAVRVLASREGRAAPAVFANLLGEPMRRVDGLVSHLSEVLNLNQFEVLVNDRAEAVVKLDLELLRELFGKES